MTAKSDSPILSEVTSWRESTAKEATDKAAVAFPFDKYVKRAKLVHSRLMKIVTFCGGGFVPSLICFDVTKP